MGFLADIAFRYIEAEKQVAPLECCDHPTINCWDCPALNKQVAQIKEVIASLHEHKELKEAEVSVTLVTKGAVRDAKVRR